MLCSIYRVLFQGNRAEDSAIVMGDCQYSHSILLKVV